MRSRNNKKAFTLLELLLALTIFSFIGLCLYASFSTGVNLSRRAETKNKLYREIRWSIDQMASDLENAVLYDFQNSYADLSCFQGEENQVVFLLADDHGLKFVRYSLGEPSNAKVFKTLIGPTHKKNVDQVLNSTETDNRKYLIREEISFSDFVSFSGSSISSSRKEILSTNVEDGSLKFQYAFLENPESKDITWRSRWGKKYVPSGVSVAMTFINPENAKDIVILGRKIMIPVGSWGSDEEQPGQIDNENF